MARSVTVAATSLSPRAERRSWEAGRWREAAAASGERGEDRQPSRRRYGEAVTKGIL